MNLRVKFTKEGYLKYISHLDLMRLFQRVFRRGNIPVKYTQGFNPQPKLSIANPLALGIESIEEFMEIDLYKKIPEKQFIDTMNEELPEEIKILDVKYIDSKKSISSIIGWGYYEIQITINKLKDIDNLDILIKEWLDKDEIIIERIKRKGKNLKKENRDIRPFIGNVTVSKEKSLRISKDSFLVTIDCLLKAGDKGNLKPTDFLKGMNKYINNLDIDIDYAEIKRLKMFGDVEGEIISPM